MISISWTSSAFSVAIKLLQVGKYIEICFKLFCLFSIISGPYKATSDHEKNCEEISLYKTLLIADFYVSNVFVISEIENDKH